MPLIFGEKRSYSEVLYNYGKQFKKNIMKKGKNEDENFQPQEITDIRR